MIKKIFSLIMLGILVSCSSNTSEEEEITTQKNTKVAKTYTEITNKTNTAPTITKQKYVHQVEKSHDFSAIGKKDDFIITLTGKNIIDGDVDFKIISYNKKTIYEQRFKANMLIGFGSRDGQPMTKKEQENFIIKRMNEFFADKNFLKPAIKSNDKLDPAVVSPNFWNNIKSDKNAIGFYYLLGKEDARKIAYDKKSGKVVLYNNCC